MVPCILTVVVAVKCDPLIVSLVPAGPLVGEKRLTTGAFALVTVKLLELVPVPFGVVTVILPVVALEGTFVVICVPPPFTLNDEAACPLNLTDVVPWKFEPLIVTEVPGGPVGAANELIVGAGPSPVQ